MTRGTKIALASVGSLVAASLVIGGIVIVNQNGPATDSTESSFSATVRNGYAWQPITYLEPDERFRFRLENAEALAAAAGNTPMNKFHSIVDVYLDKEFTIRAPGSVDLLGSEFVVSGWDESSLPWSDDSDEFRSPDIALSNRSQGNMSYWTNYDRYYVVQSYDASGAKLAEPIVHTITSATDDRIDPVTPVLSAGDHLGTVKVSWQKPANMPADGEYLIVKAYDAQGEDGIPGPRLEVIAKTTETSWQPSFDEGQANSTFNAELALFETWTADDVTSDVNPYQVEIGEPALLGVIAISDTVQQSPVVLTEVASQIGKAPLQRARELSNQLFSDRVGDLTEIVTWFPVVTLDGTITQMPMRLDPDSVRTEMDDTDAGPRPAVSVAYTIPGTLFSGRMLSYSPDGVSADEWMHAMVPHIHAFNERSILEAPKVGDRVITGESNPGERERLSELTPVSGTPETDYEIVASNPLSEYLAGHMFNGAESIDVAAFLDDPSLPSAIEAAWEVQYQNPLLSLAVDDIYVSEDKVLVLYYDSQESIETTRAEVTAIAESVAAEVTSPEMGDAEKATAINKWMVDNIEYDYAALEMLHNSPMGLPDDYEMRAWDTRGALLDGMVVCGGYADTFNLLAREAGLEAIYVQGPMANGVSHAWNHVNIDGVWKALDTTWNDNGVDASRYLLINESEFTDSAARTLSDGGWITGPYQHLYATP